MLALLILLECYYACYKKVLKKYFIGGRIDVKTNGGGREKNIVGMEGKEDFQN